MTISIIVAQDATGNNESSIPANILACGYDTGSEGIAWTTEQFAARTKPYPAIHIDQDQNAANPTSDILDVEAGAATINQIVGWLNRARANYNAHVRPGQRWPGIYCDLSTLTPAVDALITAKMTDVPFWIAEDETLSAAIAQLEAATGPYPRIGVQYAGGTTVDYNVFNLSWVTTISGEKPVANSSFNYELDYTTATDKGTQSNWAWCDKCQGLFYGPNEKVSVCPAGGTHAAILPA